MNVTIIGTGNVATVLGRSIKAAGHHLLQVYGRSLQQAIVLATELQCEATNNELEITNTADVYLIAVSDTAITQVAQMLGHKNGLVMHTAGSVSIKMLQGCSHNYGVLYPLQSLRKEKFGYENIPLLVEGNNSSSLKQMADFAATISQQVQVADENYRLKIHVAAVMVNNFTNYLYSLAADYCQQEQLDFSLLRPLILETTDRLKAQDPRQVQTGPAIRNDQITIDTHLQLLTSHPHLKQLYAYLTEGIQNAPFFNSQIPINQPSDT